LSCCPEANSILGLAGGSNHQQTYVRPTQLINKNIMK